ncbi:MAG: hypothetical protein U0176_27115, partial [Bacteroidia bacterium]
QDMRRSANSPMGVHWAALHRIVAWEPESDYPEIFECLQELMQSQPSKEIEMSVQDLLRRSTHPRAKEILNQSMETHKTP